MLMARHYNIDARGSSAGWVQQCRDGPVCVCVLLHPAHKLYMYIYLGLVISLLSYSPFFWLLRHQQDNKKGIIYTVA
jgi:hypothetical protein